MPSRVEVNISGVDASCLYAPALLASMARVETEVSDIRDQAEGTPLIPMVDDLVDYIPELESYLQTNPCNFVKNGECPVAIFMIKKATGEL